MFYVRYCFLNGIQQLSSFFTKISTRSWIYCQFSRLLFSSFEKALEVLLTGKIKDVRTNYALIVFNTPLIDLGTKQKLLLICLFCHRVTY